MAARDTRIMIGQMKETNIPPKSVEALCAAAIADPSRGHERVQEKYRRRADALCARGKIRVSDIVRRKLRLDGAAPCDSAAAISERIGKIDAIRRSVIFLCIEPFAF